MSDRRVGGGRGGRPRRRESRGRTPAAGLGLLVVTALWLGAPARVAAEAPDMGWLEGDPGRVVHLRGMTFVASEGSSNEIILRAASARFYPAREVADLEDVSVQVAPGPDRVGFSMDCDTGRLNLATEAFVAEGRVLGTIEGGRRFEAQWVAYDDEAGLLYTDDPVLIIDSDGRYRGGGFRYLVDERRFRLLGGATIVQDP